MEEEKEMDEDNPNFTCYSELLDGYDFDSHKDSSLQNFLDLG